MSETIGTPQVLPLLTSTGQTSRQIAAQIYGCQAETIGREELEPVSKALSHLKKSGRAVRVIDGSTFLWMASGHETNEKIVAAVKNETVPAEEADTAAQTLAAIAGTLGHFGIEFESVADGVYNVCVQNLALSSGLSSSRKRQLQLAQKRLTKLELAQAIVEAEIYPSELSDLCEAIEVLKKEGYKVVEDAQTEAP